jgi:hypothetical protein
LKFEDYPAGCAADDNVECLRGEDYYNFSRLCGVGSAGITGLIILVSMFFIFWKVRQTEIQLNKYAAEGADVKMQRTKETGIRALYYIGAFFICFWPLVAIQITPLEETEENRTIYFVLSVLSKLLNPLQGFFNAWIFMRCKHHRRLVDEGRSSLISRIGQSGRYMSRSLSFGSRNSSNNLVSQEGNSTMLYVSQLQLNVVKTIEEEIDVSQSGPNIEETKEVES